MDTVELLKFFNAHDHLRQLPILKWLAEMAAEYYSGVVNMGNTVPPTDSPEKVFGMIATIKKITRHLSPDFQLFQTMMLTKDATAELAPRARMAGTKAVKIIPGLTSYGADDNGISLFDLPKMNPIFAACGREGLPVLIHNELKFDPDGNEIHELLREKKGLEYFSRAVKENQDTIFVHEHVSTKDGIDFTVNSWKNIFGTVAAHYLYLDYYRDVRRSDGSFINSFNYCLPVVKHEVDRNAILRAITGPNNTRFMLGTDSARHPLENKTGSDAKPGIFAPAQVAIPAYWQKFVEWTADIKTAVRRINRFGYENARQVYDLPEDPGTITLINEPWVVPEIMEFGGMKTPVFLGGQVLEWQVKLQ